MHSTNARHKILKSWSGIDEVTIIKEVSTKGEHIQLCIQYWAQKRNITEAEYTLYFYDVVQTYVERLLSERLVCKAENVLRNVKRDVRYFYFQFASECEDKEIADSVLDYLRAKDSQQAFTLQESDLCFYWSLVQQLRECTELLIKFRQKLPRLSLEGLIKLESNCQQRLFVELYFAKDMTNEELLKQLSKFAVWKYLVDMRQLTMLQRWCQLATGQATDSECNSLEQKFAHWTLEPEMFDFAIKELKEPSQVLRNCFASMGYVFTDEECDVSTVLRRICTTKTTREQEHQHQHRNKDMVLANLPMANHLRDRGYYELLLQPFVSESSLEELSSEGDELLRFIMTLKTSELSNFAGFDRIAKATTKYCKKQICVQSDGQLPHEPILTFQEFLYHEPSIASLNACMTSSTLNQVAYLKSLSLLADYHNQPLENPPTPHDFLCRFKNIDLSADNDNDEADIASFSNERLCQRYGRKYQLNSTHYLKQQRSAYAVYYLLTEQLQLYAKITRTHLFNACEAVIELALSQAGNKELLAHCIAFCEMLGFDSQYLRCFLVLRQELPGVLDNNINFQTLLQNMDSILALQLAQDIRKFPLQRYQALMCLATRNSSFTCPRLVLTQLACADDWWHLLLLLQYFDVPLGEFRKLAHHFDKRILGEHLLRALAHEPGTSDRSSKRNATRQQNRRTEKGPTTSAETILTMSTSLSSFLDPNVPISESRIQYAHQSLNAYGHTDLFAIMLFSRSDLPEERIDSIAKFLVLMQNASVQSTSTNLLRNCVKYQQPMLAVFATALNTHNFDWSWLIWLTVYTEQWQNFLQWAVENEKDYVWSIIKQAVRQGQTAILLQSFQIFFKDSSFLHLCQFLHLTQTVHDFGETAIAELRLFLLGWSNDAAHLPLCELPMTCEQFMQRCINLLITHLQHNFDSTMHQHKFLDCICRSDINDICGRGLLDFCLLNQVFGIAAARMNQLATNFELLVQSDSKEYSCLLNELIAAKAFDDAIVIATMLQFPICDIIYSKWASDFDAGIQHSHLEYEQEIAAHALPPDILVNFLLYAANARDLPACARKYRLLKSALEVIKLHHLFPNESFDRDQIEYDMILCYMQIIGENPEEDIQVLGIYHSEYFEQIMLRERVVLYKSFLELKELAGIEDLSVSAKKPLTPPMQKKLEALLNALLDQGDIVEALRLQELFDYRPADLRFLVFCMALAEGVATIFSMSAKERQLLSEVDKCAFAKFNKLSLNFSGMGRISGSGEFSDSCSTLEFEEIPSKEKQQTLEIIQGIASKLKFGIKLGKRVVLVYRAAMYLDKEYLDVLRTKDVTVLLKSAAEEECLHRLVVVSDILVSTDTTAKEIAEILALELATCIVRPRFYIFNAHQQLSNVFKNADLWGYNIDQDFHLFLALTPNTTMLGNCLLEYCDALKVYRRYQDNRPFERSDTFQRLADIITRYGSPASVAASTMLTVDASGPQQVLSHKKQNIIYVELLIKAHQCFVHECSMEGIANVLHRAKSLNLQLTHAKSWTLIVRMLIGIARYREMFYCFDALIENEQFESLLGQFDEEQKYGLRQAILAYLREYNPRNSHELFKLAALHFLMYKELAEMWEQEAHMLLAKVRSNVQMPEQNFAATKTQVSVPMLKNCEASIPLLLQVLEYYTHATENYLLDNKLLLAQNSASMAELVAMQIDLASRESTTNACVSVLNVQTREEFRELVNTELSVPQSLILSRAYNYDVSWSEALLLQFVILQRQHYLTEYLSHHRISDDIIEHVVNGYLHYSQQKSISSKMEKSLTQLVELIKSVTLKYKLASILGFKSMVMLLINDTTHYYLRDTNFGRTENRNNIPDI